MATVDATTERIKEEVELYKIEKQYGILVKSFNLFLFGNGQYWVIPFFWSGFALVGAGIELSISSKPFEVFFLLCIMVECCVNFYFGYKFCAEQQLTKMIYYYYLKYNIDKTKVVTYFHYAVVLNFFCMSFIAITSCIQLYEIRNGDDDLHPTTTSQLVLAMIVITINVFTMTGASIYLCIQWCMEMYILQSACADYLLSHLLCITAIPQDSSVHPKQPLPQTGSSQIISPFHRMTIATHTAETTEIPPKSFIHKATSSLFIPRRGNLPTPLTRLLQSPTMSSKQENDEETQGTVPSYRYVYEQKRIERELLAFFREIKELCDYWQMNHLLRTVTGLVIVSYLGVNCYLAVTGHAASSVNPAVNAMGAFVVGFDAAIYYISIWCTALSAGAVNDFVFGQCINQLTRLYTESEAEEDRIDQQIAQTIFKLNTLQAVEGVHFGGSVMTMEKAVSVGSLLASIISFCINYFAAANV